VNLRQIVELTGIISAHSFNLIEARGRIPRAALARYGEYSEARARLWSTALEELPRQVTRASPRERPLVWGRAEGMLIDVLAGGLVARVWGAVLTSCDRARRTIAAEKLARSALSRQLQAQCKVLELMVAGPHLTLDRAAGLDRLRRKIERWTDLWLGHLVGRFALTDFAFDLERALDFGQEQLGESWEPRRQNVWQLYFICLHSAFPGIPLPGGEHDALRNDLFRSILACFPRELFLDDGRLKSIRLQRLMNGASRPEGPPARSHAALDRRRGWQPGRWRK